jgi:hypothetical protein
MPSSNPVDYGADPCGLRNSAWAINECLFASKRCDFPVGTFLLGSSPGAKIINRVRTGGVATFNTSTPHGLVVGEKITLYGFTDGTFNGTGPLQFGFTILSIPTPTQFTAAVPGADAPLVTEDGWINLIGGGYTSSLVMGYPPFTGVINNVAFTGQGIGKTILKFANNASTKRGDTFGFNIQMLKTLGNYTGFGVVGAPGSYAGAPLDSINCKNTLIEDITFDGNYANNSVADIKIVSVQRTNGINTYNVLQPLYQPSLANTQFYSVPSPAYIPPISPAPYTNISAISQYISNVVTAGPGNDASFIGFGSITNVTSFSFERDLRVVLLRARINPFGYAIYTKHPQWNFGFTTGDSINVTGFASAAFNGTFVVAGFLSTEEVFCLNAAPTTATQIFAFTRTAGNAIYDTSTPHGFVGGETVLIEGLSNPAFNGTFVVNGYPTPTQFTCANPGTNIPVTPSVGYVYTLVNENARAWAYPNVALTPQTKAGVNSLYTVAGINHVGENALIQNNQFYDFGVGIADQEAFIVKSFLPMNVNNLTVGARVLNNDFSYQGRNSIQSTLYPGSAESNTQCVVGGFSSLIDPINVVSRVGGVATYTCVMKHTLRVGDVVSVTMGNYVFGIISAQRQSNVVTFTTSQKHFLAPGNTVFVDVSNNSFDGSFSVVGVTSDFTFTVAQVGVDVFPAISVTGYGIVDLGFAGSLTIISTPDAFRFTANTGGANILPGAYLDGQVIMLRSQRIFASECQFKYNRVQGGPNPVDQQSPVTAITVRETSGADISYNNFDGFRGTCFYVDSYQHKGTHIHNNSALNISAFIALVVQDWFTLISGVPSITNPETYSTLISGHKDMLIENNDVLLTGPGSWFYQTAYTPLDAVFLVNNHDVNKSTWYYPTDYQIPISTVTRAAGISTFTTASAHELQVGMEISTISVSDGTFNGVFTVLSTPAANQFTVTNGGTPGSSTGGFLGINSPVHFPWEIRPIGFQRTAGVATYTTNKAHQILLGYHVTVEGLSNASFNDQVIVTGTPTTTTFTCASPGPDVPFTSETGNFFRYVDNIQIGCNSVRRLSGQGLVRNNGGQFGNAFLTGRPNRCVAPLEQFFYFDCPEGCLALECDPGPCKPNDYIYRI